MTKNTEFPTLAELAQLMEESVVRHTVVLDVAYDTPEQILELLEDFAKNDVACRVLAAQGPGGGWPELELKGTKADIMKCLPDYFDMVNFEDFIVL
jgi:hypothetical protein